MSIIMIDAVYSIYGQDSEEYVCRQMQVILVASKMAVQPSTNHRYHTSTVTLTHAIQMSPLKTNQIDSNFSQVYQQHKTNVKYWK